MTFQTIEDEVREILEYNEAARSDDMKLYAYYAMHKTAKFNLGKEYITRIFIDERFRIMHGIAPYESVSRIRRKLQAKELELRPSKQALEEKKTYEKNYRAYAREKGYR